MYFGFGPMRNKDSFFMGIVSLKEELMFTQIEVKIWQLPIGHNREKCVELLCINFTQFLGNGVICE